MSRRFRFRSAPAVFIVVLAVASAAWADQPGLAREALPRHLESQVETTSASLATVTEPAATRLMDAPNPYRTYDGPLPLGPASQAAELPLSSGDQERHWFQMEDSGDWMGLRVADGALLGLQVDFTGPAEEPPETRKILSIHGDPYAPRFVLTTAGLSIRF